MKKVFQYIILTIIILTFQNCDQGAPLGGSYPWQPIIRF
jgi:hypothetical protein